MTAALDDECRVQRGYSYCDNIRRTFLLVKLVVCPPLPLRRARAFPNRSVLQVARRQLALRGPVGFVALSKRLRLAAYFRSKPAPSSHPAFVAAAAAAADASVANGSSGVVVTDRNTGPFLSLRAFKDALSEVDCGLTGKDLTNIFTHLDDAGRGEVDACTISLSMLI